MTHALQNAGGNHRHLEPQAPEYSGTVVITGGLGFMGTNLAIRLLRHGQRVILLDNFSREGAAANSRLIISRYPDKALIVRADVRDVDALRSSISEASVVFHLAAQVAVTSSLQSPCYDFEVNALGTFKLLEALKALPSPPLLIFTSTNKVYGGAKSIAVDEIQGRYLPRDPEIRRRGFDESLPLSFESPYGCSKGAADQYVLDYAASFELPAIVFRLSCVYGVHQHGTEDQGWVSHLLRRVLRAEPITIFGDGKQVRDILYIEDLLDVFMLALRRAAVLKGQAFNVGGGPENAISLLDLLAFCAELGLPAPSLRSSAWRMADQRYFVCDSARFRNLTAWRPKVPWREGVKQVIAHLASAASTSPDGAA